MPDVLIKESTNEVEIAAEKSAAEIMEIVTEILGYDICASAEEGYRELAEEQIRISEQHLAVGVEAWPEE